MSDRLIDLFSRSFSFMALLSVSVRSKMPFLRVRPLSDCEHKHSGEHEIKGMRNRLISYRREDVTPALLPRIRRTFSRRLAISAEDSCLLSKLSMSHSSRSR